MKKTYETTQNGQISGARIAIIQASWHSEHTDRMVSASKEVLERAQCSVIDTFRAPGSYEIPLIAKLLAKQEKYDAIIVYGVILKGETDHYEVILQTCIRELGRVMYDFEVPIIMEILPVYDIQHVVERTQGANNKGFEAAQATIDMLTLRKKIEDHDTQQGEIAA